jgi:hypothetical protein
MYFRLPLRSVVGAGATAPHRSREDFMGTALAPRGGSVRRVAALGAIALCVSAATTGPALAGGAARPLRSHAGTTVKFRFYSVIATFVYRRADGTVAAQPPRTPAAGDQLEITENGYNGTHLNHSKKVVSTSHTVCRFTSAKPEPTCDGEGAVGGNQLLLFHSPRGGGTKVVGGTGRYQGATGSVKATTVGKTNNSDIVITVHLGG